MARAPWQRSRGVDAVLEAWRHDDAVRRDFALDRVLAPTESDAVALPDDLPEALREVLRARGITALYRHQREALELARAGRHFVVATPTASAETARVGCVATPSTPRSVTGSRCGVPSSSSTATATRRSPSRSAPCLPRPPARNQRPRITSCTCAASIPSAPK
jgi:hypothetical protein